jgi:hypothetical protein
MLQRVNSRILGLPAPTQIAICAVTVFCGTALWLVLAGVPKPVEQAVASATGSCLAYALMLPHMRQRERRKSRR